MARRPACPPVDAGLGRRLAIASRSSTAWRHHRKTPSAALHDDAQRGSIPGVSFPWHDAQPRYGDAGDKCGWACRASTPGASLRLVEGRPEAEQRQAHVDRFLVGVLHGDFQLAAGSHGGNELVGQASWRRSSRHWCRSGSLAFRAAPLSTLIVTGSVRLRPSGSCHHHGAGLAVGGGAHHQRHQQLPGLALEDLLDRAAVERLAVAGALDPPGGGAGSRAPVPAPTARPRSGSTLQ